MPDIDPARLRAVRDTRAHRPEVIAQAAHARSQRRLLDGSGQLMLLAADHSARGALGVRNNPLAMGDRDELISWLVTALARPGVDGVLGTADIVEDLLLMGALDGKVVIGSMNRGGLHGAAFEFDDRFTGYDPQSVADLGLDGGKMLCRISLSNPARSSHSKRVAVR